MWHLADGSQGSIADMLAAGDADFLQIGTETFSTLHLNAFT